MKTEFKKLKKEIDRKRKLKSMLFIKPLDFARSRFCVRWQCELSNEFCSQKSISNELLSEFRELNI